MTIGWLTRNSAAIRNEIAVEVKPVWLPVEERLTQIARSEELKKEADDIKDIASSIVRTLVTTDDAAQILKHLAPILQEIPPLLKEVQPILKSIDSQFAAMSKLQTELKADIDKLHALILDLSKKNSSIHGI